jgi:hypothetical protein
MDLVEVDPRSRFFNENGDSLRPFVFAGWRGGVLDPDRFHHAKIPKFLFDSIVQAARPEKVFLRSYTPDSDALVSLDPSWDSFCAHRFEKENWSLEYVLYDGSGKWAVLLDPDAVVVGAEADLADRIDAQLNEHGTSLSELTHKSFPDLDPDKPYNRYYFAVINGHR